MPKEETEEQIVQLHTFKATKEILGYGAAGKSIVAVWCKFYIKFIDKIKPDNAFTLKIRHSKEGRSRESS